MTLRGFGLGLRHEFLNEIVTTERAMDWLEIRAESWIHLGRTGRHTFDRIAERWPVVPHSVTMSIGGAEPLDAALFRAVSHLCTRVEAPFWSDHVCFATAKGTYFNDLLPLPFSDEALDYVKMTRPQ